MPFQPAKVQDFIGGGLTFPITLVNGRGTIDSGFTLIRASIRTILAFTLGQRFYLGEFGSLLEELIEEPNDQVLHNLINSYVVDAVTQWEKRIETISTSIVETSDIAVQVNLNYKVVNVQNPDDFVYPFYRQIIY